MPAPIDNIVAPIPITLFTEFNSWPITRPVVVIPVPPAISNTVSHAYHLYPLQIDFKKTLLSKKDFYEKMKQQGILFQVHYIPVHLQPYYRKQFGFKKGDFPIAEKFYDHEVTLPIYPKLSRDDQNIVINNINKFYAI